jgi:predicted Zn-dependent peptidase
MRNEFINYELALELKQLGFDEPCFGEWQNLKTGKNIVIDQEDRIYNVSVLGADIKAPTFSQAFRWFREKYNLHSNISSWRSDDNLSFYHEFEIYSLTSSHSAGDEYSTYEEAELACIKKLIEIVKEK